MQLRTRYTEPLINGQDSIFPSCIFFAEKPDQQSEDRVSLRSATDKNSFVAEKYLYIIYNKSMYSHVNNIKLFFYLGKNIYNIKLE